MYDFAVLVTCHLKDKYLERIYDFKNYGLLNIKNVKIKVFFLCGSEQPPVDLLENCPYEVQFVNSERFYDGPKLYDFVAKLDLEEVKKYRWWLKVDADSISDVSVLLQKLDEEFDWERAEYIFGDYGGGTWPIFEEAIKQTKHVHKFFYPNTLDKQIFHHEFESCVISCACMQKIIQDEECIKLLKILSEPKNDTQGNVHDQGLAIAARFVKVHGSTSLFMTSTPNLKNFSLFGGRFAHIHFIHRRSPEWPIFLAKLHQKMLVFGWNVYE